MKAQWHGCANTQPQDRCFNTLNSSFGFNDDGLKARYLVNPELEHLINRTRKNDMKKISITLALAVAAIRANAKGNK